MLALAEHRDTRCPSCGLDRRECMARENDGRYRAVWRRCHATTAILIAADAHREKKQAAALMYGVELIDGG